MKKPLSFTEKVYAVVQRIPRGSVMTYAAVAQKIGNPKAVRAVGNALNKNTNKDVPCHRVVRSDGTLGGYNKGVKAKELLLRKEGVFTKTPRVQLPRE
ncbi:MAG: MGMT family protein [Patescibacteria group bacterium]